MRIDILTVVPELLESPLNHSIVQRAKNKGLVEIHIHDIREYGKGNYHQVDDYSYGGDAGMVIMLEPVYNMIQELKAERRFNLGKIAKFLVVAAVCFTFIASNINYRVQINELNGAIVSLDKELNEKKSENTRLNMALNSKISLENVQDYAENVLGMVKRERYQIIYFDLETGNEIIPAQ